MKERTFTRRNGRPGVALIMVLTILGVILTLAVSLILASNVENMAAFNRFQVEKARHIAVGGIELAKWSLSEKFVDQNREKRLLFCVADLEDVERLVERSVSENADDDFVMKVSIEDEQGKVDLNHASPVAIGAALGCSYLEEPLPAVANKMTLGLSRCGTTGGPIFFTDGNPETIDGYVYVDGEMIAYSHLEYAERGNREIAILTGLHRGLFAPARNESERTSAQRPAVSHAARTAVIDGRGFKIAEYRIRDRTSFKPYPTVEAVREISDWPEFEIRAFFGGASGDVFNRGDEEYKREYMKAFRAGHGNPGAIRPDEMERIRRLFTVNAVLRSTSGIAARRRVYDIWEGDEKRRLINFEPDLPAPPYSTYRLVDTMTGEVVRYGMLGLNEFELVAGRDVVGPPDVDPNTLKLSENVPLMGYDTLWRRTYMFAGLDLKKYVISRDEEKNKLFEGKKQSPNEELFVPHTRMRPDRYRLAVEFYEQPAINPLTAPLDVLRAVPMAQGINPFAVRKKKSLNAYLEKFHRDARTGLKINAATGKRILPDFDISFWDEKERGVRKMTHVPKSLTAYYEYWGEFFQEGVTLADSDIEIWTIHLNNYISEQKGPLLLKSVPDRKKTLIVRRNADTELIGRLAVKAALPLIEPSRFETDYPLGYHWTHEKGDKNPTYYFDISARHRYGLGRGRELIWLHYDQVSGYSKGIALPWVEANFFVEKAVAAELFLKMHGNMPEKFRRLNQWDSEASPDVPELPATSSVSIACAVLLKNPAGVGSRAFNVREVYSPAKAVDVDFKLDEEGEFGSNLENYGRLCMVKPDTGALFHALHLGGNGEWGGKAALDYLGADRNGWIATWPDGFGDNSLRFPLRWLYPQNIVSDLMTGVDFSKFRIDDEFNRAVAESFQNIRIRTGLDTAALNVKVKPSFVGYPLPVPIDAFHDQDGIEFWFRSEDEKCSGCLFFSGNYRDTEARGSYIRADLFGARGEIVVTMRNRYTSISGKPATKRFRFPFEAGTWFHLKFLFGGGHPNDMHLWIDGFPVRGFADRWPKFFMTDLSDRIYPGAVLKNDLPADFADYAQTVVRYIPEASQSSTFIPVDDTEGFPERGLLLVLDKEDTSATRMEYVYYGSKTGETFNKVRRNLDLMALFGTGEIVPLESERDTWAENAVVYLMSLEIEPNDTGALYEIGDSDLEYAAGLHAQTQTAQYNQYVTTNGGEQTQVVINVSVAGLLGAYKNHWKYVFRIGDEWINYFNALPYSKRLPPPDKIREFFDGNTYLLLRNLRREHEKALKAAAPRKPTDWDAVAHKKGAQLVPFLFPKVPLCEGDEMMILVDGDTVAEIRVRDVYQNGTRDYTEHDVDGIRHVRKFEEMFPEQECIVPTTRIMAAPKENIAIPEWVVWKMTNPLSRDTAPVFALLDVETPVAMQPREKDTASIGWIGRSPLGEQVPGSIHGFGVLGGKIGTGIYFIANKEQSIGYEEDYNFYQDYPRTLARMRDAMDTGCSGVMLAANEEPRYLMAWQDKFAPKVFLQSGTPAVTLLDHTRYDASGRKLSEFEIGTVSGASWKDRQILMQSFGTEIRIRPGYFLLSTWTPSWHVSKSPVGGWFLWRNNFHGTDTGPIVDPNIRDGKLFIRSRNGMIDLDNMSRPPDYHEIVYCDDLELKTVDRPDCPPDRSIWLMKNVKFGCLGTIPSPMAVGEICPPCVPPLACRPFRVSDTQIENPLIYNFSDTNSIYQFVGDTWGNVYVPTIVTPLPSKLVQMFPRRGTSKARRMSWMSGRQIPAAVLSDACSEDDAFLPIGPHGGGGLPPSGYVRIEDEVLPYESILRRKFRDREHGLVLTADGDGKAVFRGAFGTEPDRHKKWSLVFGFPYLYHDLCPNRKEGAGTTGFIAHRSVLLGYDYNRAKGAPSVAEFTFSRKNTYLQRLDWETNGNKGGRVVALVRIDGDGDWNEKRVSTDGRNFVRVLPPRTFLMDKPGRIDAFADKVDIRLYFDYVPERLEKGWHKKPITLNRLKLTVREKERVYSHEEWLE